LSASRFSKREGVSLSSHQDVGESDVINNFENSISKDTVNKAQNVIVVNKETSSIKSENVTISINTNQNVHISNKDIVIGNKLSHRSNFDSNKKVTKIVIEPEKSKTVDNSTQIITKKQEGKGTPRLSININDIARKSLKNTSPKTFIYVTSPTTIMKNDFRNKKEAIKIKLSRSQDKNIIIDYNDSPSKCFNTRTNCDISHSSSSYNSFIHEIKNEIISKNKVTVSKRTIGTFNRSIFPFNEETN
jgi:hypothetical protein